MWRHLPLETSMTFVMPRFQSLEVFFLVYNNLYIWLELYQLFGICLIGAELSISIFRVNLHISKWTCTYSDSVQTKAKHRSSQRILCNKEAAKRKKKNVVEDYDFTIPYYSLQWISISNTFDQKSRIRGNRMKS